jgi:hypothetical protein
MSRGTTCLPRGTQVESLDVHTLVHVAHPRIAIAFLHRLARPRKRRSGGACHPHVAGVGGRAGQAMPRVLQPLQPLRQLVARQREQPPPALKVRVDGRPLAGKARAHGRLVSRERRAAGAGPPDE